MSALLCALNFRQNTLWEGLQPRDPCRACCLQFSVSELTFRELGHGNRIKPLATKPKAKANCLELVKRHKVHDGDGNNQDEQGKVEHQPGLHPE